MSGFGYGDGARALRARLDTERLAGALLEVIVHDAFDERDRAFIESLDMFWLSTVDADGMPTVSYKGGPVGLVAILDERTLAFPSHDGSGMYRSAGNIDQASKVGVLFMDFERPLRIRLQGEASLSDDAALVARWPGARFAVRVAVTALFQNCPRHVRRMRRVEPSRYVPDADGSAPVPGWKRIGAIQPVLAGRDRHAAESAGGLITTADCERMLEHDDPEL